MLKGAVGLIEGGRVNLNSNKKFFTTLIMSAKKFRDHAILHNNLQSFNYYLIATGIYMEL